MDLLELFRLEVDDAAEPFLWSDAEYYTYLNDAQDVHVRLTGGFADRTSPFTKLTYKIGDQFLKYDPRILRIKGAWDQDNKPVSLQNLDNFDTQFRDDDYGMRLNSGLDDGKTGSIKFLITDVEENKVQLYPIPDVAGFIRLYVYRRPLVEVTKETSELEVASQFHLNLLNWVKYKAYMKQDVETFDKSKAEDFRQAFVDGVVGARKDKIWREDRKRSMAYGGI